MQVPVQHRASGLSEEVEIEVQDNGIIIRSAGHPRRDWAEAFKTMARHGDDKLLDENLSRQSRWDNEEWQW